MVSDAFRVLRAAVDRFALWRVRPRKAIALVLAWIIGCGMTGRAEDRPFRTEYHEEAPAMVLSRMAIRAYEEKPKDWPVRNTLPVAMAYYVTRDYLKSSLLFEKVLAREPGNLCASLGYGGSLVGLGKFKEAVSPLKQVWEKTQKIDALVKLATCYYQLGDKSALEAVLPDLLTYKYDDLNGALSILCNYALVETDGKRAKEILASALAGVPDGCIASDPPLLLEVQVVLQRFDLKERQRSLEKAAEVLADE